ncbi:MAG: 8-oxo-dGTP diphosphatase [Lachnospiraceae bacterium]|nr:8-oxo-dGTP diphosphatase [Lachnospiraceae bacterium]
MKQAQLSTLCHIIKDGKYLMMHRVKKQKDINKDKWIGVGGKFEYGESPDECLLREVKEETGLTLLDYKCRGIVTFIYGEDIVEYMHVYTSDRFEGELTECEEGELVWVPIPEVYDLPIWEGDKIFLRYLEEDREFFSLKLVYSLDDELLEASVH